MIIHTPGQQNGKKMNKVKWLFEKDVFEDNTDKMIEEVEFQGMKALVVPYVPFDDDIVIRCSQMLGDEECVVFYGSLNFGKKLQRKLPWVPGVYLNEKTFECTTYYPKLGNLLLHYDDFIMLPYGSLYDKEDMLFKMFGDKLFIRPNSGTKEFTGFVTSPHRFEERVKLAGFYDVEPELLVLVSKAFDLEREWRFVIVDGKVISGSLYRYWGELADDHKSVDYVISHSSKMHKELHEVAAWRKDWENAAWDIAQKAADKWQHDQRAWTIDVCQTKEGEVKVLEIGCFSCAGMYDNNLRRVISAVSKAALAEWNEYFKE